MLGESFSLSTSIPKPRIIIGEVQKTTTHFLGKRSCHDCAQEAPNAAKEGWETIATLGQFGNHSEAIDFNSTGWPIWNNRRVEGKSPEKSASRMTTSKQGQRKVHSQTCPRYLPISSSLPTWCS